MPDPSIVWTQNLEGLGRVPVVQGDSVVTVVFDRFSREYQVKSFHKETGAPEWVCHLPAGGYSTPVVTGSYVFSPTAFTKYAAIDRRTGKVEWTHDFGTRVRSSPVLHGSKLLVATATRLVSLETATKAVAELEQPGAFFFGRPLVQGENAWVLATANPERKVPVLRVYCFDLAEWSFRWQTEIGPGIVVSSDTAGMAYGDGMLFAGDAEGGFAALDAETGRIVWRRTLPDMLQRSAPVYGDGRVYVAGVRGTVAGFAAETGDLLFERPLSDEGIWSSPTPAGDRLIVHAGNDVLVLNAVSGEERGRLPIGHAPYSNPVLDRERLFICAGDPPDWGLLFALDLGVPSRISVVDRRVYYDPSQPDQIAFAFRIETASGEQVEEVAIDCTPLGGSQREVVMLDETGMYRVNRKVKRDAVQGEYALLVMVKTPYGSYKEVLPVSTRFTKERPAQVLLSEFPLAVQQSATGSGPAIMRALLGRFGKQVSETDIAAMAGYISRYIMDPHHLWRSGAVRMMHASGNRLAEAAGEVPGPRDLFNR